MVEGCCALELQSLTFHPLWPDHANDNKSVARGSARPFYHHQISRPECHGVISGRHRGTTRLNHHLALRHSHLAISVYQADRGVKPSVRDGSFAHANNKPAPSLITAADPQQRGQERQLFEAHCIFHYSSTFFSPPSTSFVINYNT